MAQKKPFLYIQDITDLFLRKNFEALKDYFQRENQLLGFQHIDITFTKAETNYKVAHNLGFTPLDVLTSHFVGPGTLTWNYDRFNSTHLDITTSDECRVRAFIGLYQT